MYRTGAAIPALSDYDFSNILIYLPPKNEIAKISSTVEKGFQLREIAKREIKQIKTAINIEHITNRCT